MVVIFVIFKKSIITVICVFRFIAGVDALTHAHIHVPTFTVSQRMPGLLYIKLARSLTQLMRGQTFSRLYLIKSSACITLIGFKTMHFFCYLSHM